MVSSRELKGLNFASPHAPTVRGTSSHPTAWDILRLTRKRQLLLGLEPAACGRNYTLRSPGSLA